MSINVKDAQYAGGAKGDARLAFDGSIQIGTPLVNSASGGFTSDAVGKRIWAVDPTSGNVTLTNTTIAQYNSPTQVQASVNALATIGSQILVWGTDDTAAFNAAFNAAIGHSSYPLYSISPKRIECPDGAYILSGRFYNNLGTLGQEAGPSLIGDGKTCTSFLMAPNFAIPNDGTGALIQNLGYGARFEGFSINGCGRLFPLLLDQDIFRITSAQAVTLRNISINSVGAVNESAALGIRSVSGLRMDQVIVQNGSATVGGASHITAMRMIAVGGEASQCMTSNFPNGMHLSQSPGRDSISGPFKWIGGAFDECTYSTCKLTNNGQINVDCVFAYSTGPAEDGAAFNLDATSKLWVRDSNIGRFQGYADNGGGGGYGLVAAAGAEVFSGGNTWRGTPVTPKFMKNLGRFVEMGGDDFKIYSADSVFQRKLPVQVFSGNLPVGL